MSDSAKWILYIAVIKWLLLIIVFVIAIVVLHRIIKSFRKQATPRIKTISKHKEWHYKTPEITMQVLSSCIEGLSTDEANTRIARYGSNKLAVQPSVSLLFRFLYQFHNVLVYVLVTAGGVTAVLGHWIDAGVIMGVVVINAVIGFVQEGKAENALKAIQRMLSVNAMVVRDKLQTSIPAEQLVPGDIVLLQAGDKVPADLRLVKVKGMQIQESILTGESLAVDKQIVAVAREAAIGDRRCIAYSGTLVTHGQATGVVIATGGNTELGRISEMVADVETVTTPLLRQMAQFGRWLTLSILVLALFTYAFGVLLRDYSHADMFLAAVSLAVAAIPEGLPAIMTITLAIGVQRMAQRNAIIRKLPAVETLGAVTVICTDKTGTLTRNEMTVRKVVTTAYRFDLEGTGYNPHGSITLENKTLLAEHESLLTEVMRAAMLCNDTRLEEVDDQWQVHGDPMEGALLIAGLKAGLESDSVKQQFPRTDLIPFEAEHRFMATLHHNHSGEKFVFIKGAPERILEMCTHQRTHEDYESLNQEYWQAEIKSMARQGQRVLAIAMVSVQSDLLELNFNDVESGLTMLGLFGIIDPPREEAIEAIRTCHAAGIRVMMITGDHVDTARAIAQQLNLHNVNDALTGQEIDTMTKDELIQQVQNVDVYARVSPAHKLLLVKLLQEQGMVVAMTGDGVNDAPALKRADIGTAMGKNGTEAAKEAAEMVLADDNFSSITLAVKEGRTVYDNLRKAILFILPTNGGEALIILAAVMLGFKQLPLTPVQILWVNMVTAVTLALSLAFEPPEKGVMRRSPRSTQQGMLTPHLIWRVVFVSIILMSGTFGLFLWEMNRGVSIEQARTVAVNTLVMFEVFYLLNSRYITASIFSRSGLTGNKYVLMAIATLIGFQLMFTYLAPMQKLFGSASIGSEVWLLIVLISSSVLFLVELEKYFVRRFVKRVSSSKGKR